MVSGKTYPWINKYLKRALLLVLLFFAFSSWFQKINNFDFWWHIKTGQYILEHKALPDKDPFTYTFLEHDRDAPEMPAVVLRSYWLSQVIFFLIYQIFGPLGMILFKISVFAALLIILWKHLRDRSASVVVTFIMLAGFIIFAKEHIAERPQIFSFLLAAIVFYLLEKMREAYSVQRIAGSIQRAAYRKKQAEMGSARYTLSATRYVLLPLVMLLWANMHRGYLVGTAFIIVYGFVLAFKRVPLKIKAPTLLIYFTSICITLLNPVTYHPLTSFISTQLSPYRNEAFEFNPLFNVTSFLSSNWYPFYVMLIMSAIIIAHNLIRIMTAYSGQRTTSSEEGKGTVYTLHPMRYTLYATCYTLPLEHLFLLAGTGIAALSSIRYAMFFMIVAVPVVTIYLSKAGRGLSLFSTSANPPVCGTDVVERSRRIGTGPMIIPILLSLVLLILSFRSPLFTQKRNDLIDSAALPVKAVEFLKQKSLEPNIYNDVDWGGYMIWKLYPQYKVFTDTRALNLEVYRQYLSVLHANETMYMGKPEWKALLDMYSISTIIHGAVNPYSGEIWPLMLKLLKDDEWHLVYADGQAVILVRKRTEGLSEFPKDQLRKRE